MSELSVPEAARERGAPCRFALHTRLAMLRELTEHVTATVAYAGGGNCA